MRSRPTRRQFLRTATAGSLSAGVAMAGLPRLAAADSSWSDMTPANAIRYCLNTSTIRGQKLSLSEEIALVGQTGYDGIEPWIREIQASVEEGVKPETLKAQVEDAGLTIDSAIGFASWIVDDAEQRKKGLETMRRDMELLRSIGGTRIAAPPVGATHQTDLDLDLAAERYAEVLKLGREIGVRPQLEVWGFSKSLSQLSEVMYVATAAGDGDACVLPDVYHLYKGGNTFKSLAMVAGKAIQVMHLNDYPTNIPLDKIADRDRVYPGDGDAPLDKIVAQLRSNGFQGTFSLELFNPEYWSRPAEEVAATGLAKMKAAVASSESATGW